MPGGKQIAYEDKNHYPFSLTSKDFLIIDSQEKMDEVFRIIHQHTNGKRFSPIPAVMENETYLVIKPDLKNSNDISVESVVLNKDILYVQVKAFENPDFRKESRFSPNILLKLKGKVSFKKITIK
uniref:Hsp20/alpha crystallin family protein n=1 Tax=Chryseobacterium endophyticum TaxID=1854762 RepID=A0AAU6WQG4_9FLAO